MFRVCLTIFLLLTFSAVFAQQVQQGIVTENKTRIGLIDIFVRNLSNNQLSVTDYKGGFKINAKANDMLVLSGFGYKTDTVLITNLRYLEIFMQPVDHLLAEVKINAFGKVNKQATLIPFDKDFHNQTMLYQRDPKTGYYKGGVDLRIFSNKKTEKDQAKLSKMMEKDATATEIAEVFSDKNIAKYVPLKEKELISFIMRFTPSVETFRSGDFELTNYLSACYKEFLKLTPEERQKTSIFN